MMALLKALHIGSLVLWCAALIALPLLLGLYRKVTDTSSPALVQENYTRFRRLTRMSYIRIATPAAVIAIAAGTTLIFAAQVFQVWLLVKLALVAGMVLAHVWLGHMLVLSGERGLFWRMPRPVAALLVAVPCMLGVLWLVLAKPDLADLAQALPDWMTQPHDMAFKALVLRVLAWLGMELEIGQESLP